MEFTFWDLNLYADKTDSLKRKCGFKRIFEIWNFGFIFWDLNLYADKTDLLKRKRGFELIFEI
ncbi:hypothetical protein AR687_19800 [Flavobacteriaceae bacterium CRH]|nr:hypothetical protein AR687_19800 [Flavobacteriaceae bacterium CRH]